MSESNRALAGEAISAQSRPIAPSRYRVLGTLGEGGMGVVYRVHDPVADRVIAQKRMVLREAASGVTGPSQSGSLQASAVARFRREYHTLAQLSHPNIIEVYDYGIDELGPYYTMEVLEGEDLRRLAPVTPLAPSRSIMRFCAMTRSATESWTRYTTPIPPSPSVPSTR